MDKELDLLFKDAKTAIFAEAKPLEFPTISLTSTHPSKEGSRRASKGQKVDAAPESIKEEKLTRKREVESPERLARTIFVGNVPKSVVLSKILQKSFKKLFSTHGPVESVRFRSIAISEALPKRVAVLTGKLHERREGCNSYVVMESAEGIQGIIEKLNGTLFEGRHLRLDHVVHEEGNKLPTKKSIFVGNLPLTVDEETLWKVFGSCGVIDFVRVVRDKASGLGKGIAYVAFKDKASVELALQLNGNDCEGRPVRVSKCSKQGYQQVKKARNEKLAQIKAGEEANKSALGSSTSDQKTTSSSIQSTFDNRKRSAPPAKATPNWKMPKLSAGSQKREHEAGKGRQVQKTLPTNKPQPKTILASAAKQDGTSIPMRKERKKPKHIIQIRQQNKEPKHPAQIRMERKNKKSTK